MFKSVSRLATIARVAAVIHTSRLEMKEKSGEVKNDANSPMVFAIGIETRWLSSIATAGLLARIASLMIVAITTTTNGAGINASFLLNFDTYLSQTICNRMDNIPMI